MITLQDRPPLSVKKLAMTERLKRALEDSAADPDRLHQRLFFALCRDLTELAALENSVEATMILRFGAFYGRTKRRQLKLPNRPEPVVLDG
jgi:hypothetical protein